MIDKKDIYLLRDVACEEEFRGSCRPVHGQAGRAKKLAKAGYLQENGICAMWPYLVYGITDKGRAALTEETGGGE